MKPPKRSSREVAETLERLRREIAGGDDRDEGLDRSESAPAEAGKRSSGRSPRARRKPKKRAIREGIESMGGPGPSSPPHADPADVEVVGAAKPESQPPTSRDATSPPSRPLRSGGLSSASVRVGDDRSVGRVLDELMTHRRKGRGRILGVAGLPRHGKTTLADRLRERAAERPGADLRYNKTERGQVNCYYIPGRKTHHALIDLAGEDYRVLGDYDRELPELLGAFLWPVLQKLDGLVMLMALPIVWSGWNDDDMPLRADPDEDARLAMAEASRRMVDAHRMLVKYAIVARDLRRLRRRLPRLGLSPETPPDRNQVDDAFKQARPYDRPVSLVLSKADLYVGRNRPCLYSPNLPRLDHRTPLGIRPGVSDPLLVAAGLFPEYLDFLRRHVRHFKWSFCQALEDRSDRPSPLEAAPGTSDVSSLVGGEGVLDFLTRHPWRFPGIGTDRAIRWDRRLRRQVWEAALAGGTGG